MHQETEQFMKAVVVRRAGGPEVLQIEQIPIPHPKDGWSIIEVKAFGINHSEVFTRDGLSPSVRFPRVLGIECVGVIHDSAVFATGTKVVTFMGEMGRAYDGSYAQFVRVPDSQIYPVHSQLDWADLAAIPETGYTAYGSLKNLKIDESDSILVRSASSGVAVTFLKLVKAKYPQVRIVGTTRSSDKIPLLRELGYDDVLVDNGTLDTTEKFTKALELVGPKTLKDTIKHMEDGGIICQSGQLGGQWYLENFDPIEQLAQNTYLTTFYSGNVDTDKVAELFEYIDRYQVVLKPQKIFTLEEIQDAHRYLDEAHGFGKVVVRV